MSSLHDVPISYSDPAITGDDATLGHALERVIDAQQALVVRRLDLMIEEVSTKVRNLVAFSVGAFVGAIAALAGWLIAIAGLIDALDDRLPRAAVEIAIGLLHIAAAAALFFHLRRPRTPEIPS
jgi:hypothetical protein